MPKPKLIPEDREPEILRRHGSGERPDDIAVWLTSELGRPVDGRRVREFLEKVRKGRAPAAKAVLDAEVARVVTADLQAVDDLLARERELQARIGRMDSMLDDLEKVAKSNIQEMVDAKGRFIDLKKMPEAQARAIAGVEIEQIFAGDGDERYHSGDLVKVKLWDKPGSIAAIGRIRAQAVEAQKRLLELRLKLSGAGEGSEDVSILDLVIAAQRKRKEKATAGGGGPAPTP